MQNERLPGKADEIMRVLWPWIVNLWIFFLVAAFFFIPILGSHLAQRILSGLKKN